MRKLRSLILKHTEAAMLVMIFIGIVAITFLVSYKLSFLNFFFLPVILSGYFLGKRSGVLTAVFCVLVIILYLIFFSLLSDARETITYDETITLILWGSFLIITGALIGTFSEQRESRLDKIRKAYVNVLEIMFKYLECADESAPASMRIARKAGRIAAAAGLETRDQENIKSAALLSMAGDLQSSLPLFVEMASFLQTDEMADKLAMSDSNKVIVKATFSLLQDVEPILNGFFIHYIQESEKLDKDLKEVPFGSCVLALAHIGEKISQRAAPFQGREEFNSMALIRNLAGHTFHSRAVEAFIVASASD